MFKHYKANLATVKSWSLLMLFACVVSATQVLAQTGLPSNFEQHEKENREKRKEYLEKIHKAAPGFDWKKADEITRLQKHEEFKKVATGNARLQVNETFANGTLTAEWIEKGSNNLAGRIRYADYWVATNTIYAVSDGGNVWKADFNGTNWVCLNNSFRLKAAVFISVVANGTGKRIIVGTEDKRVHYSDNEGVTWTQSTGLSNIDAWGWVMKTAVSGDAARTVYVQSVEYVNNVLSIVVYRSVNKATSFVKLKSFPIAWDDWNKYSLWTPVTSHNEAYVINQDSVFAVSATATTNPVTRLFKHNKVIDRDLRFTGAMSGTTVVFYISTGTSIYRSTNKGSTWTTLNAPNTNDPWGWYGFSVSTANPNIIFWGDIELYKGTLSGSVITWTKLNDWIDYYPSPTNKLHADIPAVVSVKNASNVECQLVCTDGGLYTSTNTLATVNNITMLGMNNSQYYSVYTVKNNLNHIYAGAQDQGIQYANVDNGGILSFVEVLGGDNGRTVSTDHNSVWQTGYGDLYFYNNAQNGSISAYQPYGDKGKLWMPYILEHPTNPYIVYVGGGRTANDPTANIYSYSYNGTFGIVWSELSYDFAAQSGCNDIASIGISKINNNYWYVLTDNGKLFTSSNGGANFTMNSSFGGPAGHYFYGSAIYPSKLQLGTAWVAGSGYSNPGFYKLTNHGSTFTPLTTGLPATMVYDIVANDEETLIFAATEVGAYVFVVAENKWYPINGTKGPDQVYWDVEYISSTKTARFATYGRGIWDFKIQTAAGNVAPTVSITSPANNFSTAAPATITVTANATDSDGTLNKVEFYHGTTLIGVSTRSTTNPGPSYSVTWSNVAAGTYNLTAKAFDNLNATKVSTVITVTITGAPSCTAPQWNATTAYNTNNEVQYSGIKYKANWWTQNQRPDLNNGGPGTGQPWTSLGACNARMATQTLELSPNPIEGNSVVSVNLTEADNVEVYVVDNLGRKAAEIYKGHLTEGRHSFNLESTAITTGIYHLVMNGEKGNVLVRFIKK
jgi:chitodextrinase